MPFLTRSLILYNGSDSTPATNYTDDTDWQQTELSTAANMGEGSAGQWLLRDEGGLIPDYTAPQKFLNGHNVVIVTVGSNTLFRGRVATFGRGRGIQKVARAVENEVTLEDQNSHLRGIVVHNWVRGAETDVARAQGLVASYLSGSPRATTNLNGSNLIITGSNTISLPAKTYSGVTPYEIMQELASNADKEMFVSIDNELALFGHDYTGYASQLRISDDQADANATTYVPWTPRSEVYGLNMLSALRVYYGTDSSTQVTNPARPPDYDYWEEVFWDSESTTLAQSAARAQKLLDVRSSDELTLTCAIGPMSGDEIYKVKVGQVIAVKARGALTGRAPSGTYLADPFANMRIRELRWTTPAEDRYIAYLTLERPKRTASRSQGNQALATQPQANPTTQPTSAVNTLVKFYDANDGGDDISWIGILANQSGGAEGSSFYYFKSTAPNNYQTSIAAAPGAYNITGYTHMAAGETLKVAWRNDAAGSTGAITDTHIAVIRVDVLATGATSKWTPFSSDLTAPVGTTSLSLGRSGGIDFDRIRIYTVAAANVGLPTDNTTQQTDYGLLPGAGTDTNYARADHSHGTPPLPPRTVISVLTNNSGSNIDWGDVVRVDTAADDGFTTNTTLNFSAGWLGVAQAPIGSNAAGPILLAGYAPVINVGSNSTTRGHFLFGSNTARRAYGSATRTSGAFGQVLTTSVAPDAIIWSTTDGSAGGSVATDAIWDAAGDLAVGTGADTAARLAIGASNTHLVSNGSTASWQTNTFGIVDASSAKASGTGDITTTASLADATGATLSLEAGTYVVTGVFDVEVNNALNDRTFEGHLDVAGADQNDIANLVAPGLVNVRATVAQSWRIVGSNTMTVKLRALHSGGTVGDFDVKAANTTITAYRAGGGLGDHTHAATGAGANGGGATLAPTSLTSGGLLVFDGTITSTVNADQNDYAPTGIHTNAAIRFTSFSANRTVTGISAGVNGEALVLQNNTSFSLLLTNESASSAAANRFRSPNAATHTVRQQGSALLVYLGGRWCVIAA